MCTALKITNSMDTVNMNILITAFLCTFISAVHSTGSNSSLFESKIVGGKFYREDTFLFEIPLMATIIFENTNTIEASDKYKFTCMGTFYTRNSVLTSRTCAFCIHLNMRSFFVLKTPSDEAQPLHIDDVYFRRNVHTSNPFGILKLREYADIQLEGKINLIPIEDQYYTQDREFYSPGWAYNEENELSLHYLTLKLIDQTVCRQRLLSLGRKLHRNEICLHAEDGEFEIEDDGTPLYASYNQVLGFANSFDYQAEGIIIYILLAGAEEQIEKGMASKTQRQYTNAESSGSSFQTENPESFLLNTINPFDSIRRQLECRKHMTYVMTPNRDLGVRFDDLNSLSTTADPGREHGVRRSQSCRYSNAESTIRENFMLPILPEGSEELSLLRRNNDEASTTCSLFKHPITKSFKKLNFWTTRKQKN